MEALELGHHEAPIPSRVLGFFNPLEPTMQRALKVLMTTLSLTACLTASAFAGGSGGLEQDPASGYQCIAFEHRDYKGHTMSATAGNGWKYVGGKWNDKISSFKIAGNCHVKVWQNRDYKGDHKVLRGNVRYVGDLWNDQASSWMCYC